uniref:Uncharacterized protein n=1 Tax=Tanacetum cinerariifolium TaxID=118510 RepID=A0A6L2KSM5_TANCI|nr:hypothetical protein [Tanacetum cinerariifolium]
MEKFYSVIAWIAALNRRVDDFVDYSLKSKTSAGQTFGIFSALGDVAFTYVGHSDTMSGNANDDNILITLDHPRWLIAMANMFVIIHVIGGYQGFSVITTFIAITFPFFGGLLGFFGGFALAPTSYYSHGMFSLLTASLHHLANN